MVASRSDTTVCAAIYIPHALPCRSALPFGGHLISTPHVGVTQRPPATGSAQRYVQKTQKSAKAMAVDSEAMNSVRKRVVTAMQKERPQSPDTADAMGMHIFMGLACFVSVDIVVPGLGQSWAGVIVWRGTVRVTSCRQQREALYSCEFTLHPRF